VGRKEKEKENGIVSGMARRRIWKGEDGKFGVTYVSGKRRGKGGGKRGHKSKKERENKRERKKKTDLKRKEKNGEREKEVKERGADATPPTQAELTAMPRPLLVILLPLGIIPLFPVRPPRRRDTRPAVRPAARPPSRRTRWARAATPPSPAARTGARGWPARRGRPRRSA